jgi:hypothetical protein
MPAFRLQTYCMFVSWLLPRSCSFTCLYEVDSEKWYYDLWVIHWRMHGDWPAKKNKTWRLLDCLVSSIISMPVPARPYQSRFSLCLDLFQCCISYIWLTDFRALVLAVVLECHCVCLFQSFRELKSCSSLINAERYDRLAELSAVLWSPLFWFQWCRYFCCQH